MINTHNVARVPAASMQTQVSKAANKTEPETKRIPNVFSKDWVDLGKESEACRSNTKHFKEKEGEKGAKKSESVGDSESEYVSVSSSDSDWEHITKLSASQSAKDVS